MPDFSNKDLDKLFQLGAERYDFMFKPEAWKEMEALLRRDRRRRLLWWWLAGALLLFLLLTSLWLLRDSRREASGPSLPAQVEQLHEVRAPATPLIPEKPLPETPAGSTQSEAETMAAETATSGRASTKFTEETALTGQAKKDFVAEDEAEGAQEAPLSLEPRSPDTSIQQVRTGTSPSQSSLLEQALAPLLTKVAGEVKKQKLPELPEGKVLTEQIEPVNRRKGGFYLGFNISEESASVGIDGFGDFSLKAGLNLEYRFPRHFSVGAAVYYSRKDYSAGPGEYAPSYGFWTRGVPADQTVGYCTMLEVPLYAGYYFQSTRKNSLFVEAGLTSFIMLEEHYHFFYEKPEPGLISYWGSENEYHNWMGILQIYPGYQFHLSNRFTVQGGPFVQVPLAGVGHGNLDLYSMGINLRFALRPFGN